MADALRALTSQFPVEPVVPVQRMQANMRAALRRGLPEVGRFRAHGRTLAVAAGGPSLGDTYSELEGTVVAVNGSLRWLLERGVTPYGCGVLDPGEEMADIVEPDENVFYFGASICDPKLFERLGNCTVVLWHPSGVPGAETILEEARPGRWMTVGGGSTMGLRWLTLGYVLGFRRFHLHGLDSSFREGKTHAYPDRRDGGEFLTVDGYATSRAFLAQVADFLAALELFGQPHIEPVEIEVFGEGLLQTYWRRWRAENPGKFRCSTSPASNGATISAAEGNTSKNSLPA